MKLVCNNPQIDSISYIFTINASISGRKSKGVNTFMIAQIVPKKQGQKKELVVTPELVSTMSSYVPQFIIKDVQHSPKPRIDPAIAQFPSCILFIDVSGMHCWLLFVWLFVWLLFVCLFVVVRVENLHNPLIVVTTILFVL
jgi:hypothetical protein